MLAILAFALAMNGDIIKRTLPSRSHEGLRDTTRNYIVIHNDGEGAGITTTYRTLKRRHAGYHYFIDKAGQIFELIDLRYAANHAGRSRRFGFDNWNSFSIAICLSGKSNKGYTDRQYASLNFLLSRIHKRYPDSKSLPMVGHQDIAYPRGRKDDPGPFFIWERLTG